MLLYGSVLVKTDLSPSGSSEVLKDHNSKDNFCPFLLFYNYCFHLVRFLAYLARSPHKHIFCLEDLLPSNPTSGSCEVKRKKQCKEKRDLALLIKCKTHENSILKNKKLALLFINLYSIYIYISYFI